VLRSPADSRPSLRFSSAMNSSTPSTRFTSGRLSHRITTSRATNMTSTIGSATRNHSKKVIGSPVSSSIRPRPIRLGGLPIGSSSPPTVMP
jgi:hypothetical protein